MKNRSNSIYIDRRMIRSQAYRALSSSARTVLIEFLARRQVAKTGRQGKQEWVITNNGEIVLTYGELGKKYGVAPKTISRAMTDLKEKGFLKAEPNLDIRNNPNKYWLLEGWRTWCPKGEAGNAAEQR